MPTIITATATSCQGRNSRFKSFLNEHCYIVDFLSASAVIVLCLIILLPRVHESFLPEHQPNNHLETSVPSSGAIVLSSPTAEQAQQLPTPDETTLQTAQPDDHAHQHQHSHRFPAGELLICIGFFVFYCVGLGLAPPQVTSVDQDLYLDGRRRQSTSCCTSSRCPASSDENTVSLANATLQQHAHHRSHFLDSHQHGHDERALILSPDESLLQQQSRNDCLMLLNRHHQHHTHSKHHEHPPAATTNDAPASRPKVRKRSNYGSAQATTTTNYQTVATYDDEQTGLRDYEHQGLIGVASQPTTTIVVDEIRITSGPQQLRDQWPHSLRLLLFTIVLALVLIFFDMNVLGMIRAIKVFRATSTGALLYVAFFIMLPQKPANCNSCKEEEEI